MMVTVPTISIGQLVSLIRNAWNSMNLKVISMRSVFQKITRWWLVLVEIL